MPQTLTIANELSRRQAVEHVAGLSIDGKQWEITVKRWRKKRTLNQNALYWKWIEEIVGHISDATGYERDEVHEYLKQRFLAPKLIEIDGVAIMRFTTTGCDTKGMANYMDRIYRWASTELGLVLPQPPVATEER